MKYTIFPGCLVQYRFPEYEQSAHYILNALEVDYEYIDSFSCCGSQIVESFDDKLLNLIAGRNLALAEKNKIDNIVTLCGSCTYVLKKTKIELENENIRNNLNEKLESIDMRYDSKIKVKHLVEFLNEPDHLERFKAKIKKKLDMKVVFQNPCMLMRPERIAQIEFEKDKLIKNLLEACGAEVLEFEYQNKCCEGTMLAFKKSIGEKLVQLRYDVLKKLDAELMIISCPNCQLVYNIFPKTLNNEILPAMFFPQFLGLALGGNAIELGLKRNVDFKRIKEIIKKIEEMN